MIRSSSSIAAVLVVSVGFRTLTREASAAVVCRLRGLIDVFPGARDPDVFYDAACDVEESLRGPLRLGPLHFIWQVERNAGMPPPDSRLVVYLKRRNRSLDRPPPLEWVALDTGVLPYTPSLHEYLHPKVAKREALRPWPTSSMGTPSVPPRARRFR